jgi:hypothetical protein
LRRTLAAHVDYYLNRELTWRSTKMRQCPVRSTPADGQIVAIPCVGGLHHR